MKPTQEQIDAAHAVLAAVSDQKHAERVEELRQFVGKFFKYRNSYGSGEKWWLYVAVTALDEEHASLTSWQFQQMPDGNFDLRTEKPTYPWPTNGYVEITARKFWSECAGFRANILEQLREPDA